MTLQQFRPQVLDFTRLPAFDNTNSIDDLDTFGMYDESQNRIEEISWNEMVAQLAQGPGINSRGDNPLGVRLYTTFEGLGTNTTIASGDYVAMDDVSDGTNRESERIGSTTSWTRLRTRSRSGRTSSRMTRSVWRS